MGSRTWLASREDVALALDRGITVRDIRALDRHVASATDMIVTHSGYSDFAPAVATRHFPWPADDTSSAPPWYRLYLGRDIFASITSVTTGPTSAVVPAGTGGWTAYPRNRDQDGEPIRWLELDRSGSASWSDGSTRPQDQIAVTGVPGWSDQQITVGALDGAVNASVTTLDLAPGPATYRAGVGNQLLIGTERMIVTDREAVDTGENLGADLGAYESNTILSTVGVADGTLYARGEVISIDEEDMLIERVRGNALGVRRGWGGTTLADHTTGADIYAYRRLQVERGAAGSTAASHSDGAAVTRWAEPPVLHSLCIAVAIDEAMQVGAAYSRVAGTGEQAQELRGTGLRAAWRAAAPYFRKGRVYAV
jgi:hypothetical protein